MKNRCINQIEGTISRIYPLFLHQFFLPNLLSNLHIIFVLFGNVHRDNLNQAVFLSFPWKLKLNFGANFLELHIFRNRSQNQVYFKINFGLQNRGSQTLVHHYFKFSLRQFIPNIFPSQHSYKISCCVIKMWEWIEF